MTLRGKTEIQSDIHDRAMPWFDFDKETKTATAKSALFDALKAAVQ